MYPKFRFKHFAILVLFGSLLFSSAVLAMINPEKQSSVKPSGNEIKVVIVNGKGREIGQAVLTEKENGVRIHIVATNLPPGKHGFHIHEKAFQSFDFATAGGHFNPEGREHGFHNPDGYHMGDMMNLNVSQEGKVNAEFFIEKATLKKGDANSLLGRSILIHAGEDDHVTDPSGNSGDRIAGGNILG